MKLAYRKEFATEPFAEALRRRGWQTLAVEKPEELIDSGAVDVILAPPIDFALAVGVVDLALVPGIGITTRGFAGLMKLIFHKGLTGISSVAMKNPESSEGVIAQLILIEKYDVQPRVVPVDRTATLEEMLAVADAALLVGDDAIFNAGGNPTLLDLTDEWEDIVESPLPYMVAWGPIGGVPQGAIDQLQAARDEAVLMLADLTSQHPQPAEANAFYQSYLRGEISYVLGEPEIAALDAFYRYAFYYSLISDIPAMKFLPDGEPANLPAPK